jgi:hypothetical protein
MPHRPLVITMALLATSAATSAAHAAPGPGVTVQGVVARPARVEAPAPPRLGFLPPLENPIVELRQYDPFPECFVMLEGGPIAPDAATPSPVAWQLESHSFKTALLPVVVGSQIEIANVGRETHRLAAVGRDDLLPSEPIGPEGAQRFTAPAEPGKVVRIVSRTSPHLEGRLVPLPTRYFSRLDRNGRFKIDNVPPGRWTVKLWFRDGWASVPPRAIDVPGPSLRIDVGDALSSAPPAGAEEPAK